MCTRAATGATGGAGAATSTAWLGALQCELACDADVEFYTANGSSVATTVADIENVINAVSWIYELDTRVSFVVTTVVVRTAEPDPYSSADPATLLASFRQEWITNQAGVPRDVAQLFTGRDLTGTPIGVSYTGGTVGTNYGYNVVQSRYTTDLGKRVGLSAHELGHNFDADHCDGMDMWCRIMCSTAGNCSGAYHSFGPWEAGTIRAYAETCSCLTPTREPITTATLPFSDGFTCNGNLDPTKWTAVDRVLCEYGRAEIGIGRGFDYYQRLGTMRTLPLPLTRPRM